MPLPTYTPAPLPTPAAVPVQPPTLSSARRLGHAPNTPVTVTGVTATVTVDASSSGAAVTFTAPPSVSATVSAGVSVTCDAADVTLTGGAIAIDGETALVSGDPGVGIVMIAAGALGDFFANPFLVGGSGGVVSVVTTNMTIEDTEPAYVKDLTDPGSATLRNTVWIRYTPNANGTVTITGQTGLTRGYVMELFEGDALDNLVRVAYVYNRVFVSGVETVPKITQAVSSGTPIYLRVFKTGSTDLTATMTFALTGDASPGLLTLTTTTPTFSTSPGVIRADVVGGTPGGDLVFDLIGTTATFANPPGISLGNAVATYSADTSGNLYAASIALPTVSAGTYSLRVTDSSGGLGASSTIQVEADPIVPPATVPPDDPIGTIPPSVTVNYWVLKDPAPSGLGTYVFTINPTTMTSPHAPRNVTIDHTAATDGHDIIWEGAYKANEWRFQGTVLTETDYESIVGFAELNRRFWIVDHRLRGWVCSIESIGWTKKHAPYNDWAWDYDITALIYVGPVSI